MSNTLSKWSGYGTPVTLIAGTSLNALANGGWATSGATFLNNGTNLDQLADIFLQLPSAITAGAGTPRVDVYVVPVPDGTNAPTPPGTSAAATPPGYYVGAVHANASASFTSGVVEPRGTVLPAGEYLVTIQNNLGAAFPTSDSAVFAAYPYGDVGDPV